MTGIAVGSPKLDEEETRGPGQRARRHGRRRWLPKAPPRSRSKTFCRAGSEPAFLTPGRREGAQSGLDARRAKEARRRAYLTVRRGAIPSATKQTSHYPRPQQDGREKCGLGAGPRESTNPAAWDRGIAFPESPPGSARFSTGSRRSTGVLHPLRRSIQPPDHREFRSRR